MKNLSSTEVGERVAVLKSKFVMHEGYADLSSQFERLLQTRRAEIAANRSAEQRGIVIVAKSGGGKTTAVDHLISTHPELCISDGDDSKAEVVSLRIPSPATLKFVGYAALTALGYPIKRDRPASFIWDQVRFHLKARRTLFLHLDEAQDIYAKLNERQAQSVVNTLKSIMQNKDWPVGLILSGTPELKKMLNYDIQLARRFYPIEFKLVSAITDSKEVVQLCKGYCEIAKLGCHSDVKRVGFAARIIHAACHEFGLVIETIIGAIEEALVSGDNDVESRHFVKAFRRKSGCIDGLNPFIADDFERIDCRELFADGDF